MKSLFLIFFSVLTIVKCNVIKTKVSVVDELIESVKSIEAIYNTKICNSEPTCNMIDRVSPFLKTLDMRNCMCDSDCNKYGDCCLDSPFYNETQQENNYNSFHCSYPHSVYVKRVCPTSFINKEIKENCERNYTRNRTNKRLVTPVTNINEKITYANEYCAKCNGVTNFVVWNISYTCWTLDFLKILENIPVPNEDDQEDNLVKYIKYNFTSRVFESNYKNNYFQCVQIIEPTLNITLLLRKCIRTIFSCSGTYDESAASKCKSFTSIVFKDYTPYRNQYCAECNGIKEKLSGCQKSTFKPRIAFSTVFDVEEKPSNSVCDENMNEEIKKKFCLDKI